MAESEKLEALDVQLEELETSAGGAQVVLAAFQGELRQMQATVVDTGRDVRVLSGGISRGLRRAIDGMVFDGMKLSEALRGVAQSMADAAYNAALKPVTSHVGGLCAGGGGALMGGLSPFAQGGAFTQGRVIPFATGGVVSSPVMFPMRGATGLMGEAGPEAIMPLSRGADGRLGVRAEGGGRAPSVVVNITTPDVEGFRRSQSQVAAQLTRALARGQRNR
jgi:hypothetical protein